MKGVPKDLKKPVKIAVEHHWRLERRKKHAWLWAPDGKTTISIPSSPSDFRGIKNTLAELRRADVPV